MKYENLQGQRISNRYAVGRLLGYGGMGSVYLVHDELKHRDVAMKVLHDKHRDHDWIVARFAREVEVLRTLHHPNVVDLYDAGKDGRRLYYTMEHIRGCNLREWMFRHNPMEFGSAVHVICLAARGLHYVHQRYIHRDIAPENLMLRKDGVVKLIDFGLARKNKCTEGLTLIGTNLGRNEYNSPEQKRNAAVADFRADLYPLGVMLYEMLAGELPPRGVPLERLAEKLPPGCGEFLARTLAPEALDRYPDAKAAGAALLEIYQRAHRKGKAQRFSLEEAEAKPTWRAYIRQFFRRFFPQRR
jgi:serine/threonine-protein kinase